MGIFRTVAVTALALSLYCGSGQPVAYNEQLSAERDAGVLFRGRAWSEPVESAALLYLRDGTVLICQLEDLAPGGLRVELPDGTLQEIRLKRVASILPDALPRAARLHVAGEAPATVRVVAVSFYEIEYVAGTTDKPETGGRKRIEWRRILSLAWNLDGLSATEIE